MTPFDIRIIIIKGVWKYSNIIVFRHKVNILIDRLREEENRNWLKIWENNKKINDFDCLFDAIMCEISIIVGFKWSKRKRNKI